MGVAILNTLRNHFCSLLNTMVRIRLIEEVTVELRFGMGKS